MKLNAALAKSLLMAASIGMVVPISAQTAGPRGRGDKVKTPTSGQPSGSAETAENGEAEVTLPGIVIPRANGTFMALTLEDGKYNLAFYDAEKKPMAPDVARATARWNRVNKTGDERTVLNPGADGMTLQGARFVQPPHVFKLFLTLLDEDGGSVESHVVDFRM